MPIKEKIEIVSKQIYGADGVVYTDAANKSIEAIKAINADKMPICIAKTQYSFSDNPKLLGAPSGFNITVKDVKVSNGAGFIVVFTGNIMTMPGLPRLPVAEKIDIGEDGTVSGLF